MKYLAAYLLARLGREDVSIRTIEDILGSVGGFIPPCDRDRVEYLVESLKGKDIQESLRQGIPKLADYTDGMEWFGDSIPHDWRKIRFNGNLLRCAQSHIDFYLKRLPHWFLILRDSLKEQFEEGQGNDMDAATISNSGVDQSVIVDLIEADPASPEFFLKWYVNNPLFIQKNFVMEKIRYRYLLFLKHNAEQPESNRIEIPPVDVDFFWRSHLLRPGAYDWPKRIVSTDLDANQLFKHYSLRFTKEELLKDDLLEKSQRIWNEFYPNDPYLLTNVFSPNGYKYSKELLSFLSKTDYLTESINPTRDLEFWSRLRTYLHRHGHVFPVNDLDPQNGYASYIRILNYSFIRNSISDYRKYLLLRQTTNSGYFRQEFMLDFSYTIDFIWHSHMLDHWSYCEDCISFSDRMLDHNSGVPEEKPFPRSIPNFAVEMDIMRESYNERFMYTFGHSIHSGSMNFHSINNNRADFNKIIAKDTAFLVFQRLDVRSLCRASMVSKSWRIMVNQNRVWLFAIKRYDLENRATHKDANYKQVVENHWKKRIEMERRSRSSPSSEDEDYCYSLFD